MLWIALQTSGVLGHERLPELDGWRRTLGEAHDGLPQVVEVVRRHAIGPEDQFKMEPGFANIQHVRQGELLARDRSGEIRASSEGYVVLPLYQGLGDDGFFFAREVKGRAAIW